MVCATCIQPAVKSATLNLMYGATLQDGTAEFQVWAPNARRVRLRLMDGPDVPMQRSTDGTFSVRAPARAGDRYFYLVDEQKPLPDPVSRLLPEGVHGPAEIR